MANESNRPLMTVGELAKAAGVSAQTLRYYESAGLLCPKRTASGYRVYGVAEAKCLAQIQAMKLCGLPLATIRQLLHQETGLHDALTQHLRNLCAQEKSLEVAKERTKAALRSIERIEHMEPKDAFEALKQQGLDEFEATYGQEARERYGADAIEQANQRMMALTRDEWDAKELLEESIKVQLRLAVAGGDVESDEARELARMHERWIAINWGPGYQPEAYLGLVEGYLADPRFVAYYDSAAGEGATEFLVQAVKAYQSTK